MLLFSPSLTNNLDSAMSTRGDGPGDASQKDPLDQSVTSRPDNDGVGSPLARLFQKGRSNSPFAYDKVGNKPGIAQSPLLRGGKLVKVFANVGTHSFLPSGHVETDIRHKGEDGGADDGDQSNRGAGRPLPCADIGYGPV